MKFDLLLPEMLIIVSALFSVPIIPPQKVADVLKMLAIRSDHSSVSDNNSLIKRHQVCLLSFACLNQNAIPC